MFQRILDSQLASAKLIAFLRTFPPSPLNNAWEQRECCFGRTAEHRYSLESQLKVFLRSKSARKPPELKLCPRWKA
jgi:hypothetical protein